MPADEVREGRQVLFGRFDQEVVELRYAFGSGGLLSTGEPVPLLYCSALSSLYTVIPLSGRQVSLLDDIEHLF